MSAFAQPGSVAQLGLARTRKEPEGLGIPVLAVPVRHAIPGDQKTVGFELGDVRDQPAGGRIKLIP